MNDPVPAPAIAIPSAIPFLSSNQCVIAVEIGMTVKHDVPIPTITAIT